MIEQAVVMAAGLGTRLRPYTDLAPKPLLPLLGVPMLQYAFDAARDAGVRRLAVNIHAHAGAARLGIEALEVPSGARVLLSDESRELLGSGGGVVTAARLLGPGPFFLLNADTLCDLDLRKLARAHLDLKRERGVELTLGVFPRGPAGALYREIVLDPLSGALEAGASEVGVVGGLGEPASGKPYFVGVAVIESEVTARLPPGQPFDFVEALLRPAIARGKVGYALAGGSWFDVGSPSLWRSAHLEVLDLLENQRLPAAWVKRISQGSVRVGPASWISRATLPTLDAWKVEGPSYLDWPCPEARRAALAAEKLRVRVGAGTVAYGSAQEDPCGLPLEGVLHYHGLITRFSAY
jgi:NDP-sugar pyrophosphorylase family protein